MAAAYVDLCASFFGKTSGTQLALASNTGHVCVAGETLLAYVVMDNLTATTPTASLSKPSCATAAGEPNNWVRLASVDAATATAAGGVRGELFRLDASVTWAPIAGGNNMDIVLTLSGTVTAKAAAIHVFSALGVLKGIQTGISASASITTADIAQIVTGDLLYAVHFIENPTVPNPTFYYAGAAQVATQSLTVAATTGGSAVTNVAAVAVITPYSGGPWMAAAQQITTGIDHGLIGAVFATYVAPAVARTTPMSVLSSARVNSALR